MFASALSKLIRWFSRSRGFQRKNAHNRKIIQSSVPKSDVFIALFTKYYRLIRRSSYDREKQINKKWFFCIELGFLKQNLPRRLWKVEMRELQIPLGRWLLFHLFQICRRSSSWSQIKAQLYRLLRDSDCPPGCPCHFLLAICDSTLKETYKYKWSLVETYPNWSFN